MSKKNEVTPTKHEVGKCPKCGHNTLIYDNGDKPFKDTWDILSQAFLEGDSHNYDVARLGIIVLGIYCSNCGFDGVAISELKFKLYAGIHREKI